MAVPIPITHSALPPFPTNKCKANAVNINNGMFLSHEEELNFIVYRKMYATEDDYMKGIICLLSFVDCRSYRD